MGWGSAGELFNEITNAMIEVGVSEDKLTDVCEKMIKQFQQDDWDTEDESLEAFDHQPAVVEAFRRCGIHPDGREELAELFATVFRADPAWAEHLADKFLPELRYVASVRPGDGWSVKIVEEKGQWSG